MRKNHNYARPNSYFELMYAFPLMNIRDDAHLIAAQETIDHLSVRDRDDGEQAYLDALTDLVEIYENNTVLIPDASEADVLRELMSANRLTQPKLAKAVGISQSTISAVLNGSRALTREHIVKLARYFHISPAVFLQA